VAWLWCFAFELLKPDGCFQRRATGLQIIDSMKTDLTLNLNDIMSWAKHFRKDPLLTVFEGTADALENEHAQRLLGILHDPYEVNRVAAFNLLHHFKWYSCPLPLAGSTVPAANALVQWGFSNIFSNHHNTSEAASAVLACVHSCFDTSATSSVTLEKTDKALQTLKDGQDSELRPHTTKSQENHQLWMDSRPSEQALAELQEVLLHTLDADQTELPHLRIVQLLVSHLVHAVSISSLAKRCARKIDILNRR
jgi:hypothetical protein